MLFLKLFSFTDVLFVFVLIAFCYVFKFYIIVHRYPKGPFPIPFFGNIQAYFRTKNNSFSTISRMLANYGPISTIWFGNTPWIFISDLDLAKKAYSNKKNTFLGRPFSYRMTKQKNLRYISMRNPDSTWSAYRKLGHMAVRKLVNSKYLPIAISEIVDGTISIIRSEEGIHNEFDPLKYIQIIITKLTAYSAFGKRYFSENDDFPLIMSLLRKYDRNLDEMLITDLVPFLSLFNFKTLRENDEIVSKVLNLLKIFQEEQLNKIDGLEKDCFIETLMNAKYEVISDGETVIKKLNETEIYSILFDLFLSGNSSSKNTMYWIYLFLANYPQMQQRMRDEIAENIGDRIAEGEDMENCHFTRAFISEVLRNRNIVPMGIPHQSMSDAKLGSYIIPKDTTIIAFTYHFMHNIEHWKNPDSFDPTRFLKNGEFDSSINSHFVPFGFGGRSCLGEKYFQNNGFLILVRSLQSTKGYNFKLSTGSESGDLEPVCPFLIMKAKRYKIILDIDKN